MKEQCFDAGTIQAFLDGELSSDMLETVARHVALCDDCALLLQNAEEESAFTFDILGEEFNTLVPTERIRANVYQAIAEIDSQKISFWQKLFSFKILANPSIVAFASLLIFAGIFSVVLLRKDNVPMNEIVGKTMLNPPIDKAEPIAATTPFDTPTLAAPKNNSDPLAQKISYKSEPRKMIAQPAKTRTVEIQEKKESNKPEEIKKPTLEGEDTYLKTIASLETTVNAKKDNVLRASSRVSYEKNMALIDDSIIRMREEIRKNPKNEAAKEILRNSYQNKIELLNSVTERSELIAAR